MTLSALTSLRMILERGRIALLSAKVSDPEGRELLHRLANTIGGIALFEAIEDRRAHERAASLACGIEPPVAQARSSEEVAQYAAAGRELHERLRAYCARHRIRYLTVMTPPPSEPDLRHDTLVVDTRQLHEELRGAIDSMPPEANEPPSEVARVLEENVAAIADDRPSRIPPDEPTSLRLPDDGCLDDDSE